MPATLRGAPGGALVVTTDISSAVRTLLLAAMQTPNQEIPESMASLEAGPG